MSYREREKARAQASEARSAIASMLPGELKPAVRAAISALALERTANARSNP